LFIFKWNVRKIRKRSKISTPMERHYYIIIIHTSQGDFVPLGRIT